MTNRKRLQGIPTNIITGFLGVGKTTAIQGLLAQKPERERWAVLVNEFGEIGIDGSLFMGQSSQSQDVFIKEVPGGCMCCTAGLPMQIALNQLLQRAQPDRLLIEPTGLGHPTEVLSTLQQPHYRAVLAIHNVVTLVDAKVLQEPRYTTHESFIQQVAIADVVVANKADTYSALDHDALQHYVQTHGKADVPVHLTDYGRLSMRWLQGETSSLQVPVSQAHHHGTAVSQEVVIADGIAEANNHGEGFYSVGWRVEPRRVFDRDQLFSFLSGINAERVKAVCITRDGIYGYNMSASALSEFELDDCVESRIEIIGLSRDIHWREQLLACLAV